MKRLAMLSVHECPLASSEGKEKGGINVYVYELSKALAKMGWTIDIYTRVQDTVNERIVVVYENLRVIHITAGPEQYIPKKEVINHLDEFAKNMHTFMAKNDITYDVVHSHYYYSGVVAEQLKKMYGHTFATIMSFHTLGLMKQLVSRTELAGDPDRRISIEQNLVQTSDHFVTSSENDAQYLSSLYDCPEEKIVSISPGVDTALFHPTSQLEAKKAIGADMSHRIILGVGRIDPVKGFDVLLFALKMLLHEHPELTETICVWIVGADVTEDQSSWSTELQKLDALRKTLGLTTSVKFINAQHQEKLPDFYNAAEVVVMPSHYESFGMVALEALSCGTSVIATDVTGISPMLKTFDAGHVISANNPIQLKDALYHITTGHTKKNHVDLTTLDWSTTATEMNAVYERQEKHL
jgi:D-inositol-3-phosphate glycosyltransferase